MIPTLAIDIVTLVVLAVGFGLGWYWRGWSDRSKAEELFEELRQQATSHRDP